MLINNDPGLWNKDGETDCTRSIIVEKKGKELKRTYV